MISIVIPVRNGEKTIEACLRGVLNQQGIDTPYEVIVVDDGSTDHTVRLVKAMDVCLVQQPGTGRSAARNNGAQHAQGDILAFTDADCEPGVYWLKDLTAPLQDPSVVGVKGAYLSRQRSLVARFVQVEHESKYDRLRRYEFIDFVDTYSAAYRRDVFLQNGGFEPALHSAEDQELSFRLARKGYRMVFAPQAVVYHQHVESLRDYFIRKYLIGYWKAFMLRWVPEKALSDTYTLTSQRWQIVLLGLMGILFAAGFFWMPAWPLLILAGLVFYLVDLPFLWKIWRHDPPVLWVSFLLILVRGSANLMGLLVGFFIPPAQQQRRVVGLNLTSRALKRLTDVVGGLVGILLSLPLFLLCAIAIQLEDGGPVFFIQERAGENAKPFRVIKLRTMAVGSENKVITMLVDNPLQGPAFKFPNDPRVTRLGRFLRRWSLDETPQFWNVLVGEMSLVGPRPEETWVVALYNDEQRQRLAVKPGMTGPMQVGGRGDLNMAERLALELDYIQNYSLGRDVVYLLRTIPAVILGKGAF
jgi:lipopolysaccharide/colanic/teichoic acid biosynthesis glycosyltransferase/glycosyltransferase involved in cell wall biosynthesis